MEPERYCQEKAAPAGSNLYYATLFHPPDQKRHLHALFAFQQELADTVAECQDPGVARIKLQWWAEEIDRLYTNAARHPVSREMQNLSPELRIEKNTLLHVLSVMAEQIDPAQADSLLHLIEHNSCGRGESWRLAIFLAGCSDKQLGETVSSIGGLYYCLEFFQSARQQLNRGYCPYPRYEMEKHGLKHESMLHETGSQALGDLQDELFTGIQLSLAENALHLVKNRHPSVLFALTLARIAEVNCHILRKHLSTIPPQPITLTPLRKLWIAWRTKKYLTGK